jgi:phosphoribosyl-AMP cyclohydrolase
MPAKLSVHVPGEAVTLRLLPDEAEFAIGRDPACDIVVAHDSVSRWHARLARAAAGTWLLSDLGSKNGIRLDGERVGQAELRGERWFAIGDVFCEFEMIDAQAAKHLASRAAERRSSSLAWTQRIQRTGPADSLIADLLRGIVDIAECQRGFLLTLDAQSQMRMRACYALVPEEVVGSAFSGSRGAVARAIADRRAVFLSDQRDRAWLKDQASVIARGIRALACVPLLHEDRLLGVVYTDTNDDAKVFTDLDAELLDAFVAHAGAALVAIELDATIADLSSLLAVDASSIRRTHASAPYWNAASAAAGERP